MTTNRNSWIRTVSNFIDLIQFHLICQMLAKFSGVEFEGPYLSLEKEQENFWVVFTYFIKRGRETSKFHIAVVQRSFAVEPRQRDAKRREKKNNLWSQELRVSFPCNIRIIYLIKPVWSWCACLFSLTLTAEIWSYVTLYDALKKNCAKSYLEKKNAIKIATNSFPKNVHFKFQVYEKDRSQLRSTHSVCF